MAKRKATWIERGIRRITLPVSGDVRYRVQLGGRGAGNRRSRLCKTLEEAKALRDEWVTRGLPAKNAPPISSKHDVVATEDDGFRQRVLGLEQRGKGSAATERVRVFLKNHWPTGAALPLHAVTVTTIEEYKERRFQIPTKRRQDRCAANTVIRKLREWRAIACFARCCTSAGARRRGRRSRPSSRKRSRSEIRRAGWFQLTWLAAALRILSLRDGHDQTRTLDSER